MNFSSLLLIYAVLHQKIVGLPTRKTPAPVTVTSPVPLTRMWWQRNPPKDINCGTRLVDSIDVTEENYREGTKGQRLHILGSDMQAYPHGWPWMLYLRVLAPELPRDENGQISMFVCGATLVQVCADTAKSDIALTAAHCVTWWNKVTQKTEIRRSDELEVYGGIHDRRRPIRYNHRMARVKKVHLVPGYVADGRHPADIAVLELDKSLSDPTRKTELGMKIHPICLPTGPRAKNQKPWLMKTCYVTGWGRPLEWTDATPNEPSDILQFSRYDILPPVNCTDILKDWDWSDSVVQRFNVTVKKKEKPGYVQKIIDFFKPKAYGWPQHLCGQPLGGRNRFHSKGDSGGPLACKDHKTKKWILAGVINKHYPAEWEGGEQTTILSGFTSFQHHAEWVYGIIRKGSALCQKCRGDSAQNRSRKECTFHQFH